MSLEVLAQVAEVGQFFILLIVLAAVLFASPPRIERLIKVLEEIRDKGGEK